jgi:hypothetical protein
LICASAPSAQQAPAYFRDVPPSRWFRRTVAVMSQYMAWPTADGVWHIGTGLTLLPGTGLADLNQLLTRRHIERAQMGFHRPNDEAKFNEQFAIGVD